MQTFAACRKLFHHLDKDNDEFISKDDLKSYLDTKFTNGELSAKELDAFITTCDPNHDGHIQCRDLYFACRAIVPHVPLTRSTPHNESGHSNRRRKSMQAQITSPFNPRNFSQYFRPQKRITRFGNTPRGMDTFHITKPTEGSSSATSLSWRSMYTTSMINGGGVPLPEDTTKQRKSARLEIRKAQTSRIHDWMNERTLLSMKRADDSENSRLSAIKKLSDSYVRCIAAQTSQYQLISKKQTKKTASQWKLG